MGKIVAPKKISNLTDDTNSARNINNITFTYCNRTANPLADTILKKALMTSYNGI